MFNETSAITTIPNRAKELAQLYDTPVNFLEAFNPKQQIKLTRDKRQTYKGDYPTLDLVTQAFAYGTTKSWIAIQLYNLAEFAGVKEKLSKDQMDEIAQIIMQEYGYLKVTELMDFFRLFKLGKYGKFYGAVDPMVITCALLEFVEETRRSILRELNQEDEIERRHREIVQQESRPQKIEYGGMCVMYYLNFKSDDFTLEEFEEVWWLFRLGYERENHGYIVLL